MVLTQRDVSVVLLSGLVLAHSDVSKIFKLKSKYLSNKTRFKWFVYNHMIHINSIPSKFLLPSSLKPNTLHPKTKQ